jgi:hypothetical protein
MITWAFCALLAIIVLDFNSFAKDTAESVLIWDIAFSDCPISAEKGAIFAMNKVIHREYGLRLGITSELDSALGLHRPCTNKKIKICQRDYKTH